MSRSVISILPSCMSLGWTKRMSSSIPSSFSRAAHTSPSKSLRVTRRYFSLGGLLPSLITLSQSARSAGNLSVRQVRSSADPIEPPAALLDHDLAAGRLDRHVRELPARLLDGAVLLARGVVEAPGAGLLAEAVDRVQAQLAPLAPLADDQARGRAVDVEVEEIGRHAARAHAVVHVLGAAERGSGPGAQPLARER